ncbi:MAG: nuclear transport factor 2 family protein [Fimbriimonas sp.]
MRTLGLILLFVVSAFGVGQGESAPLRKEITKLYADFDRALNTGNFEAGFAMLDGSFVTVDEDGKSMTKKEFRSMINSMSGMMKNFHSSITVQQVQGGPNEAFAWITMQESFSAKQGNKWQKVSKTEKFVETWKKTPAGWKITYSQVQPKG